jgi:Right handed beta helix region
MYPAFVERLAVASLLLGALCGVRPVNGQVPEAAACQVISSLPTTISAPGVYCLTEDLTSTGSGITVNSDDVVIDCKHHRMQTSQGSASGHDGVQAFVVSRIAVRRCTLRGFNTGIAMLEGTGHTIEDNLIDASFSDGIRLIAVNGSMLRRNRVTSTGSVASSGCAGIVASGDRTEVLLNEVVGVTCTPSALVFSGGIVLTDGLNSVIRGNTVIDIVAGAIGIDVGGSGAHVQDNVVLNPVSRTGIGINAPSSAAICRGNDVAGFSGSVHCPSPGISSGNLALF